MMSARVWGGGDSFGSAEVGQCLMAGEETIRAT